MDRAAHPRLTRRTNRDQDAADNRTLLHQRGKLEMPVLAMAGAHSPLASITPTMIDEVAKHTTVKLIRAAGHWIAEENPRAVAEALVAMLKG